MINRWLFWFGATWRNLKKQPNIRRNIVFFSFLVLALVITWATVNQIDRNHELEKEVIKEKALVAVLQEQIKNQTIENEFLKTDYFVELAARDQLGWIKQGEQQPLILSRLKINQIKEAYQAQNPMPVPVTAPPTSSLQQWWYFFRGDQTRQQ